MNSKEALVAQYKKYLGEFKEIIAGLDPDRLPREARDSYFRIESAAEKYEMFIEDIESLPPCTDSNESAKQSEADKSLSRS